MDSQPLAHGHSRLLSQLEQCGLPNEAITALVERHTLVRYPRGSPLFLQGSPADVVFAVFSGMVKVYCPRAEGSRILVELAGPGDIIGYADFADCGGQHSQVFEAHALTNCSVALFTRQHLVKMFRGMEPVLLLKLLESINSFWSSVTYRYATLLGMSLRERLELVLGELGARFGVNDARGILLTPELAQEELAEMIGSSRPMVSKLLTEMTRSGMLARQGRRHILLRGAGLEPPPQALAGLAVEGPPQSSGSGPGRSAARRPPRSAAA